MPPSSAAKVATGPRIRGRCEREQLGAWRVFGLRSCGGGGGAERGWRALRGVCGGGGGDCGGAELGGVGEVEFCWADGFSEDKGVMQEGGEGSEA